MDPITAFSLVGTILQVIDSGIKAGDAWYKIHQSIVGATDTNAELELSTRSFASSVELLKTYRQKSVLGGVDLSLVAAKCEDTANSLIRLLTDIRDGPVLSPQKSAFRSFRRTVRARLKQKEIDELCGKLTLYRRELEYRLLADQSLQVNALAIRNGESFNYLNAQGQKIIETLTNNERHFAQFHSFLQATDAGIRTHIDKRIDDLQRLRPDFVSSGPSDDRILRSTIKDSLYFQEMNQRRRDLENAERDTFEWVFDVPPEDCKRIWTNFREWLESGSGIYWICGDPGSGKSTLVKFALEHRETTNALKKWANGRQLLVADFFLWHSGSSLQKTQTGLMRSLLYQIFEQAPQLASKSTASIELRTKFANLHLDPSDRARDEIWTDRDLLDVLSSLVLEVSNTQTYCLCLILDALDELDSDCGNLIKTLKSSTELNSSGHVKIIVSSRPWPIFEEAFAENAGLLLQQLTTRDMELYTLSRLHSHPRMRKMSSENPSNASWLIKLIVKKAEGIFLWIHLILPNLLEELRNRPTWNDLFAAVDDYPQSLDGFYGRMLVPIQQNLRHFETASRYFQMMLVVVTEIRIPYVSLLTIALADERIAAIMEDSSEEPAQSRVMDLLGHSEAKVRKCSAGLLKVLPGLRDETHEYVDHPWDTTYNHMRVQFAHQTVVDYMQKEKVLAELKIATSSGSGFSPYHALMDSFLTQIKAFPQSVDNIWLTNYIMQLAGTFESKNKIPPARLLDDLDRTMAKRSIPVANVSAIWSMTAKDRSELPGPVVQYDFVIYALTYGLILYARVKLGPRPSTLCKSTEVPLLHYAIAGMTSTLEADMAQFRSWSYTNTVSWFLENGTDPNMEYSLKGFGQVRNVTLWQFYLIRIDLDQEGAFSESKTCLSVMKVFLQHGANPNQKSWSLEHPDESAISVLDCLDDRCHHYEEVYQMFLSCGATIGIMC